MVINKLLMSDCPEDIGMARSILDMNNEAEIFEFLWILHCKRWTEIRSVTLFRKIDEEIEKLKEINENIDKISTYIISIMLDITDGGTI